MTRIAFHGILVSFVAAGLVTSLSVEEALTTYLTDPSPKLSSYLKNFPFRDYRIVTGSGGLKFYIDLADDLLKAELVRGRLYEKEVEDFMDIYARPGSVVIDVGAHIGTHTLSLARRVGSLGHVVAFEPQPKIFRELFMNCALNSVKNARLFNCAIGDREDRIELSPLVPGNEGGTSIHGGAGIFADLHTLDHFQLTNVSLIKVDIEGMEDDFLRGARATILANRPVMIVEIQSGNIYETSSIAVKKKIGATRKLIRDLGYYIERIDLHNYSALPKGREK
jgi:FkbM family methyltransferase